MKIHFNQLEKQLGPPLLPLYIVVGDEPLLVQEACDRIRGHARSLGFTERESYTVDAQFDWQHLSDNTSNLSLFGDRKLIELKLAKFPVNEAGKKALAHYIDNPSEDNLLLIASPKIDNRQQKAKWFTALEQAGCLIQVWPVERHQLPQWISNRLQQHRLSASPDAIQLLAERAEGNLLAIAQEIEKLTLLGIQGEIDRETMMASVTNSARYDVFDLIDACLEGNRPQVTRILHGLQQEGVEPPVILWALTREARQLITLAELIHQGIPPHQALEKCRIWDKRKNLYQRLLSTPSPRRFYHYLSLASRIDKQIKGREPGNPWVGLASLSLKIAA